MIVDLWAAEAPVRSVTLIELGIYGDLGAIDSVRAAVTYICVPGGKNTSQFTYVSLAK